MRNWQEEGIGMAYPSYNENSQYNPLMGMAGAGVGGYLSSLFGGQSPLQKMMPYMQNAESNIQSAGNEAQRQAGQAQSYLQPYRGAGENALSPYEQMLQEGANPGQLYNHLMSGFQMSPAQQYAQNQGLNAVQTRMAQEGLGSSGQEMRNLEQYAQQNTAQNQQQYLQNLLGMRNQAQSGYGNLIGMGEGAANQMGQYGMEGAQAQMNAAQQQAQLQEYLAQLAGGQQQANQTGLGQIGSAAGSLAGFLL